MRWLVAAVLVAGGCDGRALRWDVAADPDPGPSLPAVESPDAAASPPGASAAPAAGAVDAGGAPVAPPFRPLLPLSTSLATSRTPTFAWTELDGADYYLVDLCLDRGCERLMETLASGLTSASADQTLDPGVIFWRVRGHLMNGGFVATVTWELVVGRKSAPQDCAQLGRPDFDGDGLSDVALGSAGGPVALSSFVRGGVPRGDPVVLSLAPPAVALGYAGDLDGDGYGDLAVGRAGAVDVYRGGPAGLGLAGSVNGSADFGAAVAGLGDVDGDGYGDLLVAQPSALRSLVYRGAASGLASGTAVPSAEAAPAGDVNGDGYADAIACGARFGKAQLFFGSPAGLGPGPVLEPPANVTFALACGGVGDLDADGYGDLAVRGTDGQGRPLTFVYRGGPSTIERRGAPLSGGGPLAPAGDLDGDGLGDLVLMGSDAPLMFSGGLGDGVPVAAGPGQGAGVGDVDGDGYDDLLVVPSACAANPVQIFSGQPGALSEAPFYRFPLAAPCPLLAR